MCVTGAVTLTTASVIGSVRRVFISLKMIFKRLIRATSDSLRNLAVRPEDQWL